MIDPPSTPALVRFTQAACGYGERTLWDELDLEIYPGEFVAILGPNGAGKTTLLQVLLGQLSLKTGQIHIKKDLPIGYVPQIKTFDPHLPIRGQDLVSLGMTGRNYGLRTTAMQQRAVKQAIESVGAAHYAHAPISQLSGGELQRLRIAQALVNVPKLLLCDEPLVSLDIAHQKEVCEVLAQRKEAGTAILFVSHEINPIIDLIDTVVYIARGKAAVGSAQEVMTSATLSELYDQDITVIEHEGRYFVIGAEDGTHHGPHGALGSRECCPSEVA